MSGDLCGMQINYRLGEKMDRSFTIAGTIYYPVNKGHKAMDVNEDAHKAKKKTIVKHGNMRLLRSLSYMDKKKTSNEHCADCFKKQLLVPYH